ncbi:MAG: class I SAM-dependent rRNA methyltransferase [Geminicoccaceae bacterium]|nr:class I SAM-dependent rRNA methyltransferase [Geminicoccaceae bacterium]
MTYPTVRIQPGRDKRLRAGSPWLYSNELEMDTAARAIEPGSLVRVMAGQGKIMGVAHFNPHSLIAGRMLTRNKDATIDAGYFETRIARALTLREQLFDAPFYRLVHAEGDGLPGLVVDRFGEYLAVQFNTAGMQAMAPTIVDALSGILRPAGIVARNDAPVRELEGLALESGTIAGDVPQRVEIAENGIRHLIAPVSGQKTGWYYDQRANRAFAARLAVGRRALDLYAYAGGFALAALAAGASSAMAIDRSAEALDLARESAALQGLDGALETRRADVFEALGGLIDDRQRFGLVIADPPPFVRAKKDLAAGLRGYRKLARTAASVVTEPGFLALGCCSHAVNPSAFLAEVWAGIKAAGRGGRLIQAAGAAADHPVHPGLPETAYLKFLVFALD